MRLDITLTGLADKIVVSALPKAFLKRIFVHCMGKNNTPYFANNCFKGVLYFNDHLAAHFAQESGLEWKGWEEARRFYAGQGCVFESNLELAVAMDGKQGPALEPSSLEARVRVVDLKSILPQVGEDEAVILLGAVDKGFTRYSLDGVEGPFDPEKLSIALDDFAGLALDDRLVTGLAYAGAPLAKAESESRGMNMILPLLYDKSGKELDLYDFVE